MESILIQILLIRFSKLNCSSGRKLVSARSSPQLVIQPILNQIHEESEEGSPADLQLNQRLPNILFYVL